MKVILKLLAAHLVVFLFISFGFCAEVPDGSANSPQDINSQRIVIIKAVAENNLQNIDEKWQEKFLEACGEVSVIFLKDFNIKLDVSAVEKVDENIDVRWLYRDNTDSDIVIYLSSECSSVSALSSYGNAAIILFKNRSFFAKKNKMVHLIAHEIGHIFGAKHTYEMSIMRPDWPEPLPLFFDEQNKKIILENKWREFKH